MRLPKAVDYRLSVSASPELIDIDLLTANRSVFPEMITILTNTDALLKPTLSRRSHEHDDNTFGDPPPRAPAWRQTSPIVRPRSTMSLQILLP